MNQRELFLKHLAQTSPSPIGLDIVKAEGMFLFDADGKFVHDEPMNKNLGGLLHELLRWATALKTMRGK